MRTERLRELAIPFFVCLSEREAAPSDDPNSHTGPLDETWKNFQQNALLQLGNLEVVNDACYLLSTVCDERMLNCIGLPWTRSSMLARHHGDVRGGERCWEILEYLLSSGPTHLDTSQKQLLELYLLAIGLGWRGRYRMVPNGEEQVDNIRLQVHELLYGTNAYSLQTQQLISLSTRHLDRRQRYLSSALITFALILMILAVWSVHISLQQQWSDLTAKLPLPLETSRPESSEARQ